MKMLVLLAAVATLSAAPLAAGSAGSIGIVAAENFYGDVAADRLEREALMWHRPLLAAEFARRSIPSELRPSFVVPESAQSNALPLGRIPFGWIDADGIQGVLCIWFAPP